jgi:subtilisin family serine protease
MLALAIALGCAASVSAAAGVDSRALTMAKRDGSVDALIVLADQSGPLLAPLRTDGDFRLRRRTLVDALQARAGNDQRNLRAWLESRHIEHRSYWIANVIQARLPLAALTELAKRADVLRIDANPHVPMNLPRSESVGSPDTVNETASIAWGVTQVEAPAVWAAGFTGQGIVIGGEDTGYQWDHPALKPHYRGWNGITADHNYNWHDAIHDASAGNPCPSDSPAPCDDSSHGTHTAGTFVGDDGAGHQTGVAPGAKWIGCRNMDQGIGTPARYIECMQWMLAPTNLAGTGANPDLGADIVSNSWGCPEADPPDGEGCTPADILEAAVANLVAGGVFYVAAAQNSGSGCSTINDPPAIYPESFDVGATDSGDALWTLSSRGPVSGSGLIRPDVSAPGVSVYSSVPTDSYGFKSGTSMATPHVAGTAALLMSAFPALRGNPKKVAALLRATAVTQGVTNTAGVTQSCGGTPITQWPNYMVGYGRVDASNAYHEVIFVDDFDN